MIRIVEILLSCIVRQTDRICQGSPLVIILVIICRFKGSQKQDDPIQLRLITGCRF